jgi:hypothetical protein
MVMFRRASPILIGCKPEHDCQWADMAIDQMR